jgi:hypothetical protein
MINTLLQDTSFYGRPHNAPFGPLLDVRPTASLITLNADFCPSDIIRAIQKCSSSSSPGKDNITYSILKLGLLSPGKHIRPLLRSLTALFNACLRQSKTLDQWKIATVHPLFKLAAAQAPKQAKHTTNYRGISLLPCISKLLETVVNDRVMTYLELACPLHDLQNGFRAKHDCPSHVYLLMEAIRAKGPNSPIMLLDQVKAFPSCPRSSLLAGLHRKKITGRIFRLIAAFSQGALSVVELDGARSDPYHVDEGCREGAVLSPITTLSRTQPSSTSSCKN